MKRICIIFSGIFFLSTIAVANGENFIAGFEDIPLLNEMYQDLDDNISFNNEETRYIETIIYGKNHLKRKDFEKFYIETLPQLGWKLKENNENYISFYRENDVLEFKITQNSPLKILVSIKNRY